MNLGLKIGLAYGRGQSIAAVDNGFTDPPVVTVNASGDVTVKGKVKPGSFGKIIVPLTLPVASGVYTINYLPNFTGLLQHGKLAMVGFGYKHNNDFHIVGNRGDGASGLDNYEVFGTPPNGWNKETGHSVTDGGPVTFGTQAGPNWIRLVISSNGKNQTFQTGPDGASWTDGFTGVPVDPFSNVSQVTIFGLALWFNNLDTGPFSIAATFT